MTRKLLIALTSASMLLYVTSCATTKNLPDPRVSCPSIPGELMQAPARPQPIENNV